MANMKYFNGDRELTNVYFDNGKFFGRPEGVGPVFSKVTGWLGQHVQADRVIEYKSSPSRHVCDDRCVNATGKVMKCECSCGGKNHGKGHAHGAAA